MEIYEIRKNMNILFGNCMNHVHCLGSSACLCTFCIVHICVCYAIQVRSSCILRQTLRGYVCKYAYIYIYIVVAMLIGFNV